MLGLREGDRDAFGQLAKRDQRAVYATAVRRLGNHAEAQEVCQEVLVRAMQKIWQLREPEAFGSWLQAVANRMAINRAVPSGRRCPPNRRCWRLPASKATRRCRRRLAHERRSQVRAGLGRLGDLDRDTLVAFYVQGQSLVEMSEEFRSPVGTIKRRLHVARKRLAKELEEFAAV